MLSMRAPLAVVLLMAALPMLGCNDSIEDNCKAMCDWANECQSAGAPDPGCTDNCIENMKEADDACRDALDDFAGCVDGRDCEDQGECGGEAAAMLSDCVEYF
jgi:hypothetical protein